MRLNSSIKDEQLSGGSGHDGFETKPYFITICTYGRQSTLGRLHEGQMELNHTGLLVEEEWLFTGNKNGAMKLDAYCIMPNHFHAILWLASDPNPQDKGSSQSEEETDPNRDYGLIVVGEIIEKFKATVTDRANLAQNTAGIPLWQPSYHGHIIGTDKAVQAMRRYVNDNPVNWSRDLLNPVVGDPSCLVPATGTNGK